MNKSHFLEAADVTEKGAKRFKIRVISAGVSKNGNYYSPAVLREAAPLFDGARVLVRSDEEHIQGKGKDFRNLIGRLSNPRFVEGAEEIQADFELIEPNGAIAVKLREAFDNKMTDLFGFSIDASATAKTTRINGQTVREAGVVTLTAKHKGECGNMPVHLNHYDGETLPAGLTVAVTDLTGGATNPDIGDVIAAIGDAHYNFIATPYTDAANLSALKTELESRWSALRAIEGVAFGALGGELSALGEKGAALNDKHLTLLNAHGLKSPLYAVAASYMATVALYASNDPAAPFRYALNGIMTGSAEEQFTDEERNLLLHDGVSTFTRSVDGTAVIEQAITTYKTNSAGAADTAYQDVNVPLLLGYLRYDWRNYIARKYQNWKQGDDGATGAKVMTPATMKAEAVVWFKTHAENGLVENFDDFKKNLKVEHNASNRNRLDVLLPPDLMNKLDVVATQIAFVR